MAIKAKIETGDVSSLRSSLTLNDMNNNYRNWDEATNAGLRTKTQWSELSMALKKGAEPSAWFNGRYDSYALYAESEVREKQTRIEIPAVEIDLLSAIFTATRAAKRYRDAAQRCYQNDAHSFAKRNREQKERCYSLKDRGIVAAVKSGRIAATAAIGNLTVYRGEGYCFHSLLRPDGFKHPEGANADSTLRVEAKPKTRKEPRLKDALHTLAMLSSTIDGFKQIPFPSRSNHFEYEDVETYDEETLKRIHDIE